MKSLSKLVTSKWEVVNSKQITTYKLTSYDVRVRALGIAEGLTSTEDPDLTAWYCKAVRLLGESKYAAIASMAREGRNPKGLFANLLKEELNKLKK